MAASANDSVLPESSDANPRDNVAEPLFTRSIHLMLFRDWAPLAMKICTTSDSFDTDGVKT
jgi:hypothetical protein